MLIRSQDRKNLFNSDNIVCINIQNFRALKPEFESCDKCRYANKEENEKPCCECIHNAKEYFEPMTNADRIRNMSDEELVDFLGSISSCVEDGNPVLEICLEEEPLKIDFCCILKWLQAESNKT